MRVIETFKIFAKTIFKPSTAWLALFFPALLYYIGTRLYSLGLFRSSTYGEILPHELILIPQSSNNNNNNNNHKDTLCPEFLSSAVNGKNKFLYMKNSNKDCNKLRYPLYLVHDDFDNGSIVSTTWMEDDELGRGYLLISTSAGKGKVYQWETGGGPIAIGRTLHIKDSGCRSNIYKKCSDGIGVVNDKDNSAIEDDYNKYHTGSGGIAVDTYGSSDSSSRRLIVAEYGEGRVVRLEENGARTPLVIDTGNPNNDRLRRPFQLLMTPYGDLMIIDDATHHGNGFTLWRLQKASSVPALPSLSVSRKAHAWNRNNSTGLPHTFFQSNEMGGMVLDTSGIKEGEEPNNNMQEEERVVARELLQSRQSTVVFNYTAHANTPGAIEIDNSGNIYLAVENGILLVSKSQTVVAKIAFFTDDKIVGLTLGSDRFLYIATESKLFRIRVPNSPLVIKTELLIKA
ncbi:hypothetical protein FRACYDRAFT_239041 [Fragilariopsis cylindrus CCMP1102]|uniref:Calcium-dependent phosphotriesterase n=1 Tax=Fragilariopsis cylindrus CCMP1102 TaxID=635003 RepID=A0A1E7FE61_9STRA|nr:hypothetical protein FRACYDRAFT_239041 [Fragilariopsis cylindrus CCMP1102]|eukprot:OEU16449.1 hypothetical protein FRACYDRAFT_239041 [Fragilariopsis cylindrus CCMP1102]